MFVGGNQPGREPQPGSVNDYQPHVRCEPVAPSIFKARDAGAYDALAALESGVWYQVWMVVDNSRDLFRSIGFTG